MKRMAQEEGDAVLDVSFSSLSSSSSSSTSSSISVAPSRVSPSASGPSTMREEARAQREREDRGAAGRVALSSSTSSTASRRSKTRGSARRASEDGVDEVVHDDDDDGADAEELRLDDSLEARRALGGRRGRRDRNGVRRGAASAAVGAARESDASVTDSSHREAEPPRRPWHKRHVASNIADAAEEHPWYQSILSDLSMDETASTLSDIPRSPGGSLLPDGDSLAYLFRNLYVDRLKYRERKMSSLEPYSHRKSTNTTTGSGGAPGGKQRARNKGKKGKGKGQGKRTRKRTSVSESIVVQGETGTHTISAGGKHRAREYRGSGLSHQEWVRRKQEQKTKEEEKQRQQQEKELAKQLEKQREKQRLKERGHEEYRRWLDRDKRLRRKRKKQEEEKKRKEEKERQERLEKLLHETEESYKEWLYDYHIRRRKADAKEREERRKKAELRREAQKRGQAAYEKWLRELQVRPRHLRFEQAHPWRGVLDDDDDAGPYDERHSRHGRGTKGGRNSQHHRHHPQRGGGSKALTYSSDEADAAALLGWGPSPPLLFRDRALAEVLAANRR